MTELETILATFALASSDRSDEAKAVLLAGKGVPETADGLDLLARIELRLGNETEARRLWTNAAESHPGADRARRALTALASVEWRHRRLIRNLRYGIAVGFILLAGIAVGLFLRKLDAEDKHCSKSIQSRALPSCANP